MSSAVTVSHSCQVAVISTLLCIGTVIAKFTPPQMNCSQLTFPVPFPELDDTLSRGDVLFTSDDKITNITYCEGKELLAFNGSMVTLTGSLHALCVEIFVCTFICAKANTAINLNTFIKRTLPYNVSFAKEVYIGSVQEMATDNSAVRLDADLSIKFHNCIVSNFPATARQFQLSQTVPPVPFRWRTETSPNSLAVSGEIDYETNTSLTFYVKVRIPYLNLTGSYEAKIVVYVIDIDDNDPEFSIPASENYLLNISEHDNSLVNQPLETSPPIFAFDPDRSFNQTILYSIRELKHGQERSQILSQFERLFILQYEGPQANSCLVQRNRASQKDKPTLSTALAPVLVKVIAQNDQVPKVSDIQEQTIIIAAVISSLVTITVVIAASVIIGCLLMKRLPLNNNYETSTRVRKAGGITSGGDDTVSSFHEVLDQTTKANRVSPSIYIHQQ